MGWFGFFKLMKRILATKSKSEKDLLVHQQLRLCRNGQHYQIDGKLSWQQIPTVAVCVYTQSSCNYRSGTERSVL